MFDYDICLCGNGENCPKKEECKRYVLTKKVGPGVYTYSLFYNEKKECEDFYPIKRGDK